MAYTYRIADDHGIEVLQSDGTWARPVLTGAELALFRKNAPAVTEALRWNERRTGVPAAYGAGIGYGESGLDPTKEGPASDHGIGVMMITAQSLKQGLSDAEVKDPETNIRLGFDFLKTIQNKTGIDLPKMASAYNAGLGPHPSPDAPWGWREYRLPNGAQPYISRVVRAANTAIDELGPGSTGWGIPVLGVAIVVLGIAGGIGAALAGPR